VFLRKERGKVDQMDKPLIEVFKDSRKKLRKKHKSYSDIMGVIRTLYPDIEHANSKTASILLKRKP
jgi:hypothetical protein